jgi:hypothetical protein
LHDIIGGMVRRHTFCARHTLCAHCRGSSPTSTFATDTFPAFWAATDAIILSSALTEGAQHPRPLWRPHLPSGRHRHRFFLLTSYSGAPSIGCCRGCLTHLLGGHRRRQLLHSSSIGAPAFSAARDASPAFWAATWFTMVPYHTHRRRGPQQPLPPGTPYLSSGRPWMYVAIFSSAFPGCTSIHCWGCLDHFQGSHGCLVSLPSLLELIIGSPDSRFGYAHLPVSSCPARSTRGYGCLEHFLGLYNTINGSAGSHQCLINSPNGGPASTTIWTFWTATGAAIFSPISTGGR